MVESGPIYLLYSIVPTDSQTSVWHLFGRLKTKKKLSSIYPERLAIAHVHKNLEADAHVQRLGQMHTHTHTHTIADCSFIYCLPRHE